MESGRSPGRDDDPRDPNSQAGSQDPRARIDRPTGPPRWPWLAGGAALLLVLGALLLARASPPGAGVRQWFGGGAVCGNAQVEPGEECDDGNSQANDRCLPTCKLTTCGDGEVRARVEECDDGNTSDADGCSSTCVTCPVASDSFPSPGTGHCYTLRPEQLPFSEAAAVCAQDGGHLVSLADDGEWREVTERLLAGGNAPPVWIGLRSEDRNGVRDFGWVTGERALSAHWGIQEPRRQPADRDCVQQGEAGAWATANCSERRAFVCERPGWAVFARDGHAYRRFNARLHWPEAKAACAEQGGHLITLSDAAEHGFVTSRFQGPYWIGAIYDDKKQKFVWWNGAPLSFNDFAPGEPNIKRRERCLAVDVDRRWYDRDCDDRNGFVCEIE